MTGPVQENFFPGTSMPDADWWRALWPSPDHVLAQLGLAGGVEHAVDLCCGDGLFTPALARVARRVEAIDLDSDLLDAARRRVATAGLAGRCEFTLADAYDVARLASGADLVFLANTFHGVPDKPRLARAVARALKPSGLFSLVNWRRLPREETRVLDKPRGPATEGRLDPDALAALVEPAGFQMRRVTDLPPYHYGANFVRL